MKLLTIDFTFFLFLPNKMGILNEKRCKRYLQNIYKLQILV